MSLEYVRLAKSVCKRIPHKVLDVLLKECGIRAKRGIVAIEEALTDLAVSSEEKDIAKLEKLKGFYSDHLIYGDKTISLSSMNEEHCLAIKNNIEKLKETVSDLEIHYPYLDDTTDSHLSDEPILVDIQVMDDGILFVYASLKALVEKIELDETYFTQINVSLPSELYDVTAKRCIKRRYYDSAFLKFDDLTVEFRLDTASISSKDSLQQSLSQLRATFLNTVAPVMAESELEFNTINLFPAVPGAYEHSKLRVCELGFSVGSVIHHEKMRTSTKDLRNELFHQGGKKSIDDTKHKIRPFRIALRKAKSIEDVGSFETELYLPGLSKMLSSITPTLEYAIVSNCISSTDYNFHVDQMKATKAQYLESILKK
ncbi:hypothetical protein V8046_003606 [Vibrio parahaemolyticus]